MHPAVVKPEYCRSAGWWWDIPACAFISKKRKRHQGSWGRGIKKIKTVRRFFVDRDILWLMLHTLRKNWLRQTASVFCGTAPFKLAHLKNTAVVLKEGGLWGRAFKKCLNKIWFRHGSCKFKKSYWVIVAAVFNVTDTAAWAGYKMVQFG